MEQPWKPTLPIIGVFRRPEGGFNLICFDTDDIRSAAGRAADALERADAAGAWAAGICQGGIWVATASCRRDLIAGLTSCSQPAAHMPDPGLITAERWSVGLRSSDFDRLFDRGPRQPIWPVAQDEERTGPDQA